MKLNWRAIRWQFWLGLVAFVLIMLALVWGGSRLYQTLMDEQQVPLDAIVIQGDLYYTTADEIRAALTASEVGSFFAAEVDTLRQRIEQLPWIYSASVRKEWPGRLRIYAVEQTPVAVWNETSLLNRNGEIFAASTERVRDQLPHLKGPAEDVGEVIRQFARISEILSMSPFRIRALEVTERFSVSVRLDNGISLRLGREARLERVQRFMDMYRFISTHDEREIEYVDLRYDTGVAVGWRQQQEASKP